MDLTDRKQLIDYLKQCHLWANKCLSQNFLVNRKALDKIVEAAEIQDGDKIVEIGPGVGTLTQELIKNARKVIAIELDQKMAELLKDQWSGMATNEKLKVVNDDILKVNLNNLLNDEDYKVVANIPYHITSKILELFLTRDNKPKLMVLLVQKEVAERVCAKKNDMSILSASVQLFGTPEIVSVVPKESFFPSPKVDSAILKIRIMDELGVVSREEEKRFFKIVRIGFSSRRKTLLNNLMAGYRLPREKVIDILSKARLKQTVRAQELGISDWIKLSSIIDS